MMTLIWKKGIQTPVMLTFDFDAETLWISRNKDNLKKPGTLSQGVFGANVGVPSILELLRKHEIKSTFFIPGWVAEKYQSLVEEIIADGHEIGHHGYLHEWVDPEDPEKEREVFIKGLTALEKVIGHKPVGFRSPAWETSEHMLDLLIEHDFLYSSNMMDSINPYRVVKQEKQTDLIEIPVHWMLDDAPFFLFSVTGPARPIFPAQHVMNVWKEEFHAIYKRGQLFNLVCHPQIIGRPSRIDMLDQFIQYIKSYPNIEFVTGQEVASFVKERSMMRRKENL
ncbi:ribulose phosphate epimerase [Sutcliffiella cohnii]|uniref:Ribulose phosphate epimerase n=1 Tax=Sutcliffiella cohnii TaxID=33932 RepID=A0A223KXS4_9BACI|nr:ribulose phosphate epimerase [Sutcliffiella cohnii]